jgi:hypothetical protein
MYGSILKINQISQSFYDLVRIGQYSNVFFLASVLAACSDSFHRSFFPRITQILVYRLLGLGTAFYWIQNACLNRDDDTNTQSIDCMHLLAVRWLYFGGKSVGNGTVSCLGSRSLSSSQETCKQRNIPIAYGSYDEVLNDKSVDAVYIPLPSNLHSEWVAKTGKN